MKKALLVAAVLTGAMAAGVCFGYENRAGKAPAANRDEAIAVDSVSVITGAGNYGGLAARYAGVAETQEEWGAKTDSERKVKETFVKAGDTVKAGDPLFAYDVAADEQAIEKNRIALDRLANEIETKQRKIGQLHQEEANAKTEEDILSIQTQILQEENSIKQDEYEARTTQADMDVLVEATRDSVVRSEIDGVVKKISNPNADSEDSTYSSQDDDPNFVTITAVGNLRIKGYANEQNVDALNEGDALVAYSRADDTKWWKGTVTAVKRDGDESKNRQDSYYGSGASSSTKYPFYVELEDSEGLKLGQHVYLEADIGQTEDDGGLWLYDYYLQEDEQGPFVWAKAQDGATIERRAVETGEKDEAAGKTRIESGLELSDKIAVPGQDPAEGDPTSEVDYTASEEESEWAGWNDEWREELSKEDDGTLDGGFSAEADFGGDGFDDFGDFYEDDFDDFGADSFDGFDADSFGGFDADSFGGFDEEDDGGFEDDDGFDE